MLDGNTGQAAANTGAKRVCKALVIMMYVGRLQFNLSIAKDAHDTSTAPCPVDIMANIYNQKVRKIDNKVPSQLLTREKVSPRKLVSFVDEWLEYGKCFRMSSFRGNVKVVISKILTYLLKVLMKKLSAQHKNQEMIFCF